MTPRNYSIPKFLLDICLVLSIATPGFAADQAVPMDRAAPPIVEEFTADTLKAGHILLGTDLFYGMGGGLHIGMDLLAASAGIPALEAKWKFWSKGRDHIAVGLRAAKLDLGSLHAWTNARDSFAKLDSLVVRPALSWTNLISERLRLHTLWTMGVGKIKAELSDSGRREVDTQKYPEGVPESPVGKNRDQKASNLGRRTLEMQSLFGLTTDRFQITGEFIQENKNRVLVTTRVEQMRVEDLEASSIRFTVAQHWYLDSFQFRLGVGALYLAMAGIDFDSEIVDQWGVTPVSDIVLYWQF